MLHMRLSQMCLRVVIVWRGGRRLKVSGKDVRRGCAGPGMGIGNGAHRRIHGRGSPASIFSFKHCSGRSRMRRLNKHARKGEERRASSRSRGAIGADINGVVISRETARLELVGVVGLLAFKIGCRDGHAEVHQGRLGGRR